jgi:hypothetical protein
MTTTNPPHLRPRHRDSVPEDTGPATADHEAWYAVLAELRKDEHRPTQLSNALWAIHHLTEQLLTSTYALPGNGLRNLPAPSRTP